MYQTCHIPRGFLVYTAQLSTDKGGGVCVEGEHKAVEAGPPGGNRGKVGVHSFTSGRVTVLDVYTEECRRSNVSAVRH